MNVINISKKKIADLKELELSNNIYHTESKVYNFDYKNKKKILKILYLNNGIYFANKLYTIEMLDYYKNYLPSNFIIPDNLISNEDTIIGFTIPKLNGIVFSDLLKNNTISSKEKIWYLKKIGDTLNQLKNIRKYTDLKEIFINDLNECNIIINPNNRELNIIDLDSCKIFNNGCFPAKYLGTNFLLDNKPHKYIYNNNIKNGNGYIFANENSDIYCYTIIILNYLYGENITKLTIDEYYKYLDYLNYININKDLIDIFNNLTTKANNNNPKNLLDSLTDIQICRAKRKVYDCVRK